jgi:hypothetical protein
MTKIFPLLFCAVVLLFLSCRGAAKVAEKIVTVPLPDRWTVENPAPPRAEAPKAEEPKETVFMPTEEYKQETLRSVNDFISILNGIMWQFKNASAANQDKKTGNALKAYESWLTYLSPEYYAMISSEDFLNTQSDSARLKGKIKLNDVYDYFRYVVVPSRENDRVDGLSFITRTQVKAYTYNAKLRQNLVLYHLVSTGETDNSWMIIPLS